MCTNYTAKLFDDLRFTFDALGIFTHNESSGHAPS